MQVDLPDVSLVRETMALLGPGAKDSTLNDLAAWIRQLEELPDSKDATSALATFRTDISGSCLSTFPAPGTSAQTTKLLAKAVKGYPPLPELHMEKVSSKKKNARGEAKLRLRVERGPVLVLLTITDLHGTTRTLRVVTEDNNDLIPIKHPATTIEATVIPFAPDQLLERLRLAQAKIKEQREQHVPTCASPQPFVEEGSAQRQDDAVKYMTKRIGGQVLEYCFDLKTGDFTTKSRGCGNPNCDEVNCTAAPSTITYKANGEVDIACDSPVMRAQLAAMLKSKQMNPRRLKELGKNLLAINDQRKAIKDKLSTARPGEKQRLLEELEKKNAEFAKLKQLIFGAAETGGWMRAPPEEITALLEKAKQKDPIGYEVLRYRYAAALDEYETIGKQLQSTANKTKKKRLATQLDRAEIKFDEVMNEIVAIASGSAQEDGKKRNVDSICVPKPLDLDVGGWLDARKEEIIVLCVRAEQKDPIRATPITKRIVDAVEEAGVIKEKFEFASNPAEKMRLATLLARKEIEFKVAMNVIAVIAGSGEQEDRKEPHDVSDRKKEAVAQDQSL